MTARFEIVHKPQRATVIDEGGRVVAKEPNPQPWHLRSIGANGEPLDSTETFVDKGSAFTNLVAQALMFGVVARIVIDGDQYGLVAENLFVPVIIVEDPAS